MVQKTLLKCLSSPIFRILKYNGCPYEDKHEYSKYTHSIECERFNHALLILF